MTDKALSDEESDAIVRLLKEVRDERFGGNQKALARQLGVSDGLLSEILSPARTRRAGMKVIRALAALTNKSLDEVTGRSKPTPSTTVLEPGAGQRALGDLPGWQEAMAAAKTVFVDIPPDAWDAACRLVTFATPSRITPEVVYRITSGWYLALGDSEQQKLNEQISRRVIAERDADIAALEARGITLKNDPALFNVELAKLRAARAGVAPPNVADEELASSRRKRASVVRTAERKPK